jgi:hypothetical protein
MLQSARDRQQAVVCSYSNAHDLIARRSPETRERRARRVRDRREDGTDLRANSVLPASEIVTMRQGDLGQFYAELVDKWAFEWKEPRSSKPDIARLKTLTA